MQILIVLDWVIYLGIPFSLMEGAIHHFRDMPGSSLVYMLFPFFNTFNSVICRYLLRQRGRYLFVEKHVSSIFLLVYMISITEGPIYMNPELFKIHPV